MIISAAESSNVPAIYPFGYMARDGGLISYGPDTIDQFHRAAAYAGRILKGAKPADLPVRPPVRIGHQYADRQRRWASVPASLLARADEVIE